VSPPFDDLQIAQARISVRGPSTTVTRRTFREFDSDQQLSPDDAGLSGEVRMIAVTLTARW